MSNRTAISLFSSGGIGDLAIRAAGFEILVSNELLEDRHAVFEHNFPGTTCVTGDLWALTDHLEALVRDRLAGRTLSLFYATPPCQGMSKNGRGKLLSEIRAGRKPPLDARNRLIIPTMQLACRLQPEILIFENVPEMADTIVLDNQGQAINILEFIQRELGAAYQGRAEVVEFADYGVPQCRQRLITIYSRCDSLTKWLTETGSLLPLPTHSRIGGDRLKKWVTVRDAISHLPPLDAGSPTLANSSIPFHRVPLLDELKYSWVKHTRPERSAFDNQCILCGWDKNPSHIARRTADGINRTSTETPLYCEKCEGLLPRPSVLRGDRLEIMRGFTSAYKRMSFDKPASALTRNLSYACSDNKLHPDQNRVLSLHEAFRIHSLDKYRYEWKRGDGKPVADKTIREIIGESVPPWGLEQIATHIEQVYRGKAGAPHAMAGPLFSGVGTGMDVP